MADAPLTGTICHTHNRHSSSLPMPRAKRSYATAVKRDAICLARETNISAAARAMGFPRRTVSDWCDAEDMLVSFTGSKKIKTMGGQGRKEDLPFSHELVTYMKDERRENKMLCTRNMIAFIQSHHGTWLKAYLVDNKTSEESGHAALMKLMQRFAVRHGFSSQKPQAAKDNDEDLERLQLNFTLEFWATFKDYDLSTIYNVDETAIYFDMVPQRMWALRGSQGNAKVKNLRRHSSRTTAVITARADGKKLPILFIVHGQPGGTIEREELRTYPQGHIYAVQENVWMCASVWDFYVKELLKFEIEAPSVVFLDNFDSHVSEEGRRVVFEETSAALYPLPPNSTSVCQPLDVGVMGPLKPKIKNLGCLGDEGGVTASAKRRSAIQRTIVAWESISESTVRKSFEKALPKHPLVEV